MRSVILCVDDDKYMLQALSEQLNAWFGDNYTVEKALSGEEALLIIDEYKENNMSVSVVISDYIMPAMRGDKFLELVHERDPSIKKIMLTGYSAIEGVIHAINKAGLYHFISKPWDNKALMLTVTEAIRSFEATQTLNRLSANFKTFSNQFDNKLDLLKTGYEELLAMLAGVAEAGMFDGEKHGWVAKTHSVNVGYYARELAMELKLGRNTAHDLMCAGLLHEIGKFGLSAGELEGLEKARAALDYSNPSVGLLLVRTLALTSQLKNGVYTDIIKNLYKPASGEISQQTKVLAIANMFDNACRVAPSVSAAQGMLLKCAFAGILDAEAVKIFIKNVPVPEDNVLQ